MPTPDTPRRVALLRLLILMDSIAPVPVFVDRGEKRHDVQNV